MLIPARVRAAVLIGVTVLTLRSGGAHAAAPATSSDDIAWWHALAPDARADVVRGMVAAFQTGYGAAVLRVQQKASSRISADRAAHRIGAREAAARAAVIEKTIADRTLYPRFSREPPYYAQRIEEYYRTRLDQSVYGVRPAPVSKVLLCLSDVPLVACDDVRFQ